MGEPSIDSLHDPYEDQLSAARYKAERDAAVQELQAMRERNIELWMESGMANELVTCAEQKAKRLGKLVWRLQNRLAKAHRRERNLRKGMREWREKVISAPVRTMSAYDLLPEADLETLRWVREQGGLNVIKTHTELFQQLKGERDELRELRRDYEKHGAYGLMLEYRRVLNGVCKRLGLTDGTGKPEQDGVIYEAIERRLMPEGCEWPRYESGEPVRFGDVVSDGEETGRVYYVTFDTVNPVIIGFTDETPNQDPGTWLEVSVNDGGRVKRPDFQKSPKVDVPLSSHSAAPKVLDADGVEIRVGDVLYRKSDGHMVEVAEVYEKTFIDADDYVRPGDGFTHRAPVIAADGKPLREGEAVWYLDHIDPLEVRSVSTTASCGSYAKAYNDYEGEVSAPACCFSHERPEIDSWERLEEDAGKDPCGYFGFDGEETCGKCPASEKNCEQTMARDLVRRAKALAERGE